MAQRHQALKNFVFFLAFSTQLFIIPNNGCAASQDEVQQEIQKIAVELHQSHGLNLVWEGIPAKQGPRLEFEELSVSELPRLLSFLRIFQTEIGLYPPDFFKPSGLSRIVFVKKLFNGKQPAHGVYKLPQGIMYFDIYRNFRNRQLQRHGIHHEIYHMISTSMEFMPLGWESLNDPAFKYEKEGWWHGASNVLNPMAAPVGFATEYGISSAEEDRAEVFACLMLPEQRRLIEKWGKRDAILSKKIATMKKIIQSYSPPMDHSFWGEPVQE